MTTTVGIKTPEGIVLATDRRATAGYYVADKDVVKIEPLDDDSAITIAGSVSQAQSYAHMLRLNLEYTKARRGWSLSPQELAKLAALKVYDDTMTPNCSGVMRKARISCGPRIPARSRSPTRHRGARRTTTRGMV